MNKCDYCSSKEHLKHEVKYNLMETYKKSWNNHAEGSGCWCSPIIGSLFIIHRNYAWIESRWVSIKENKSECISSDFGNAFYTQPKDRGFTARDDK
jgi:hypothetical protein